MQILDRKMQNLKKTGADILTTECPGCMIQLSYGVRRSGLATKVVHISELMRDALKNKPKEK
jgi:glycolate oxidase iron-sulfur subunit